MELKQSYAPLFDRYGVRQRSGEIKLSYSYLYRPDLIERQEDIKHYDGSALRAIEECKRLIAQLTDYRQDLCARYNELETMSYTHEYKLDRYVSYDNSVSYYLRYSIIYEDGTRNEKSFKKYSGKERHAAIKAFKQLQKEHPSALFIDNSAVKR